MLFRKDMLSTRTLLQLTVAALFSVAAVGAAFAANNGIAPLLVPYTVQTVAGTPQFVGSTTSVPVGYFGEGVPATTSLAHLPGSAASPTTAIMNGPYGVAVDSVGNLYINDAGNFIIREVNAQTGLINTIAGVIPKGCVGSTCSVRVSGCADGVPAAGAAIGTKNEGMALDAYGNVYFSDAPTSTVSVIYRGGAQVANFIKLVNPGGVKKSGGTVQPGYLYHIAGAINLTTCSATKGNIDNGLAFTDTSAGAVPTAEMASPPQTFFVTLDSAGNLYIGDTGNLTVRVINTQATPQTFFQYTVQPGYMRSITNCNALLTTACPTAPTTNVLNTGINGPVNALVYNTQMKTSQTDAYGNIYQLNGTGGGTGPPGIYAATAYAGGAPLTNLLTVEAPLLAGTYGPNSANPGNTPSELPLTYGSSYDTIGNLTINTAAPNYFIDVLATVNGGFDLRPSSFLPDNFGTFWFMDNHYPELNRIDQYTSLATLLLKNGRSTGSITPLNTSPASFTNPYYCVYGSTAANIKWEQGPQTFDPQGDGCPAVVAFFTGGVYQTVSDGLANIYVGDPFEQIERELVNGNIFPPTPVGTATPLTQAIQVHFNSSNPPVIGAAIPDGPASGNTTTTFSIAPGISDFTINTTTPEFPMGSLIGGAAYNNNSTTPNFQMWSGLPTCTQLGAYPTATGVTDYDCLVYVAFNPAAPGVRQSQLVVTTANGSIYNFALYGIGSGGRLAIDGGAATQITATGLGTPAGIAVSQSGTIYIADPTNNRVVVDPLGGGTQTNLTFTGVTPASLSGPMGVAVDSANNIYVSDTGNNRVLQINPVTSVATVLGKYVWISGSTCDSGATTPPCPAGGLASEPGAAVTATTPPPQYAFKAPQGLAVDKWNNVYVADTGNSAVVEITSNIALGGAVPLLNYPGAPKFSTPTGVAVDSLGNIYVVDAKAAGGAIIELPPGGGDLASVPTALFPKTIQAGLTSPAGIAVDAGGNLYISDSSSNIVVEKPSASGAGGTPFTLNFLNMNTPAGVALDANGNLYVADSGNSQILFSNRQSPLINFGNVPQNLNPFAQPICANTMIVDGFNIGNSGTGCPLTVTNIGNQAVNIASPLTTISGTGNAAFVLQNVCPTPLPPGSACQITATFNPTFDNGQSENVSVNGGPQVLALTANGAQPLANVVLSASYTGGTSTTTPTTGATATITATVTQTHITGNIPSGTVTFTYTIDASNKNVNSCGTGGTQTVTLSNGTASFALPVLATGVQYTVSANYNGDTLNTAAQASPVVVYVPGTPVTVTVTSTPAQLTYTFGAPAPVPVGTVTPTPTSPVTFKFGSAASATTAIGTYPVTVSFSGAGSCAYGFPSAVLSTGGPALVTELPAPLTYTIPNFTAQYGALDLTYGAAASVTGAVNGDTINTFSATFTNAASSILDVGNYTVVPTVFSNDIGNYTVTATGSTLTVTQAPTGISITAAKTAVPNTAAGIASATYLISVGTAVSSGRGIATGSVTVTDNFTPITATGYGSPAAPATLVVPLVAGVGNFVPFSPAVTTTPGIHQYSFAYSGDKNFKVSTLAPIATAVACIPSAITTNCLIVDNPDFTLTSLTGPVVVIPGIIPSGNGLLAAPNQSSAAPETAVLFVNAVLGFTGSVNLTCQTQNPTYVSCFMTPTTVCFATTSSKACTNIASAAATVVAIQTPATLPLGFFNTGQTRTSVSKTVLAFLPFGVLAFCVRRRRRLSKALWMLIAFAAIGAGMSGCGGNQVNFYTPIPTGPQTVTVTASYLGNGTNQPPATRQFVVPIAID